MRTVTNLRPVPYAKRRVLVVEDNLDSVHSMAMLVKMMGHEAQFAINGFAALEIARKFRPEVILLDIGLPDFNGCQIARQLKWESELKNTRIIAISALPEREYKKAALDAGCEEFYSKPIDPAKLEELLTRPGGANPMTTSDVVARSAALRAAEHVASEEATNALAAHLGLTIQHVENWLQQAKNPPPKVLLSWICRWDLVNRRSGGGKP